MIPGLLLLSFLGGPPPSASGTKQIPIHKTATVPTNVTEIRFTDLLVREGDGLKLSDTITKLQGKRVRITGYMAEMEEPLKGAFYLCPLPVHGDESAAGVGDIPVNAIRVIVPAFRGKIVPHVARPIIITGVLDLGHRDEPDGMPSLIRVTLDPPATKISRSKH